jgi:hypothetical protein
MSASRRIADRVDELDWPDIRGSLVEIGVGPTGSVLTAAECRSLVDVHDDDARFRSTIDMARHRHHHPTGTWAGFPTRDRPVRSQRGWSNVPLRHGVSTVRSGRRHTLGLVFHDAA